MVTPSGLADDLARRDFTINAMAVGFTGPRTGELIDSFGGATDLARGRIRTLHDHSFQDDATRLLRACRYAARFGFRLDEDTNAAAHRDVGFLATISPARIRNEFVRTFAEEQPRVALGAMERLGVPEALVAGLRFSRRTIQGWSRLTRSEWEGGIVAWLIPVLRWRGPALEGYVDRFALTHAERRAVEALPETRAALTSLARSGARPSVIVARLDPLPLPTVIAWVRTSPDSRRGGVAQRYVEEFRHVRAALTSDKLKEMGVPEGPEFGRVLRALRAARLDDPSLTLDDERRLVPHILRQESGG
jgi:tRNA nucleotidyltransferase (CCA-adding enzyme)